MEASNESMEARNNNDGDDGTLLLRKFELERKQTSQAVATSWMDRIRALLRPYNLLSYLEQHPARVGMVFAAFLAIVTSPPGRILFRWSLRQLYWILGTIVGWALGVGMGLGLATHVHDQLEFWEEQQRKKMDVSGTAAAAATTTATSAASSSSSLFQSSRTTMGLSVRLPRTASDVAAAVLEDEQTYHSLMVSAGYHTSRFGGGGGTELPTTTAVRGQVLRPEQIPKDAYRFSRGGEIVEWRAVAAMAEFWPTLHPSVRGQLGKAIEYILRDFVGCWYWKMDGSLSDPFLPAEEKRNGEIQQPPRRMMYSVERHRPIPFLDSLYESCSIVFGNLATRVEHVNLAELVLLKWMKILSHTFKWYRTLRKAVKVKELAHQHQHGGSKRRLRNQKKNEQHEEAGNGSDGVNRDKKAFVPVSEMAMTKEFLFTGKLHRAVTFGLDVPSFLFADMDGKECGKPARSLDGVESTELFDKDRPFAEDAVLEARLFETNLLRDCELDYNRVVGHRIVRALVSRGDFGSNIVSSLLTEIMGGCVLTPIMSIFTPEYLNSWLISGLDKKQDEGGATDEDSFDEAAGTNGAVEVEFVPDLKTSVQGDERGQALLANDTTANAEDSSSAPPVPQPDALAVDATAATVSGEDGITTALTMAVIDLQRYVDFEDARTARAENSETKVDWDDAGCRSAVLRLVLVIEAALTNGRCIYKPGDLVGEKDAVSYEAATDNENNGREENERPVEITLPEYESASYSQILMELTSDIDAFEERVAAENSRAMLDDSAKGKFDDMIAEGYQLSSSEQSTMRTLIAAWLHTGQVHRTMNALVQAHDTIMAPYYHKSAFLRSKEHANGFIRQLGALSGVNILVDTMTVLASPRLEDTNYADLSALVNRSVNSPASNAPGQNGEQAAETAPSALMLSAQLLSSSTTPRYLDFHRNESFAASLRSERERRMLSWERIVNDEDVAEGLPVVCRTKGVTEEDIVLQRDLHHIAGIFYAGTNMIALRDAARRRNVEAEGESSLAADSADVDGVQVSLMTVENACARRRIKVPDDDSSFLLRAQPEPLNAVGVHRDQRNHDQSFKCFAATYEEPAVPVGSDHYTGGRYLRRCLVRYYPIDRTASVALENDLRRLDQRKKENTVPDTITLDQSSRPAPFLSSDFLKARHLCQRWVPKGTTRTQSLLASSIMEPTDFTSTPRTGKAMDFVYKCGFYERPMLDLGGKHFTVQDSSARGVHRADASALEMSDASLSFALLTLGSGEDEDSTGAHRQSVEMGKDGYPAIWMKFSRKQDDARVDVKPYRTSFVRAALMITSARLEAQQRCLIKCVKAGSVKKATKALTDTYLRRTLKLVEYAGSTSREKESILLRDLKLGVNHIDRGQLRRNALLSPRYPTELLELSATVLDAVQSSDVKGVDIFGTTAMVFKIKCSATVSLIATDDEMRGDDGYRTEDGTLAKIYKEEWIVYRSLKEFQSLHKHLKSEVSVSESSGTAGSRLVGAATAAFAATTAAQNRSRQRKMLIPSLSQATKVGALGITKNLILKRKEILAGYLGYLLSPGHLLERSSELLLFLGASFPLSPAVRVGGTIEGSADPLGRTEMTRSILQLRVKPNPKQPPSASSSTPTRRRLTHDSNASDDFHDDDDEFHDDDDFDDADQFRKSDRSLNMIPAVRSKIDKVPLPRVRKQIFELLRYQFGFENASFARNRMLAALKTASFAVTSGAEFRKKLYQLHVEHVNAESIAGWINTLCDILWPGGVFFESSPPTSKEELQRQADKSKELLHGSFPDAVRAILGQELTRDGMDVLHEMLQNRMVVKSMAYMLFDLLWAEVFPEIRDVLPCGASLDIDS